MLTGQSCHVCKLSSFYINTYLPELTSALHLQMHLQCNTCMLQNLKIQVGNLVSFRSLYKQILIFMYIT